MSLIHALAPRARKTAIAYSCRMAVTTAVLVALAGCGEPALRVEDDAARDASTVVDAGENVADAEAGIDAADGFTDAGDETPDADEEEDATVINPNPAFDCENRSPDTLAATVGPLWQLVESLDRGRRLESVTRIAVSPQREVRAFEIPRGIVELWGEWPDIERTTSSTLNPILAADTSGDLVPTSAFFDEGHFVLAYINRRGGPDGGGGVFVRRPDRSFVKLAARDVTSARVRGGRLFVSASSFTGVGSASERDRVRVYSLDLSDPAARPVEIVQVDAPVSRGADLAFLGDRALLSVRTATSLEAASRQEFTFATFAMTVDSLMTASTPIVLSPSLGSVYTGHAIDDFDVTNGVAMMLGEDDAALPTSIEVVRPRGNRFRAEVPLIVPECVSIRHWLAFEGDLVIGLADPSSGEHRLVRLRPR